MEKISVFAPASVANVCAGYDVLGFSFAAVGDHMHFEKTPEKGVRISEITGAELPLTLEDNVAGVAVKALYNRFETQIDFGIDIRIEKKSSPEVALAQVQQALPEQFLEQMHYSIHNCLQLNLFH